MIDAHGAQSRLAGCRPGAWLLSPFTGAKWAKWPDGEIGWVPADVVLPQCLKAIQGRHRARLIELNLPNFGSNKQRFDTLEQEVSRSVRDAITANQPR
jgi:hypothetical protein